MGRISEQEQGLLRRIQDGEQKGWTELVDQYGRLIYYAIQRTLELKGVRLPADGVEEIFNSLFVHLAENQGRRLLSFSGKRNCTLATWIRMISINYTIDIIRRQAKFSYQVEFEEVPEGDYEKSWFDGIKNPEQASEEREKEERLKSGLDGLKRDDKNFLKLYLGGMSPQEIARVYRIPVSQVYSRYAAIKKTLKESTV